MDYGNNAVLDFLNGASEPKDVFSEKENEVIVEEGQEEKPLPFHKDPKVQKYIQKEIEKAKKDLAPTATDQFKEAVASDVEDVIGAFSTIIGNDTPEKVKALEALKKTLNGSDERATQKAVERLQQQIKEQEEQVKAQDAAALQELESGFEKIEEDFGIDVYADPKLLESFKTYLRKISPKNADGEIKEFADIPSAWETFQERAKIQPASRAKQLAARGLTRSTDASTIPTGPKFSSGDSWRQVDRYLDSLKK